MIKIGMVGVGAISGIYLENITKTFKEIELEAVCDLIRERAEKAREKYNVPKIYDTMQELFADPEIDIVLNLTRPYEHYEVTRQALEAGKHVYSEKPLGAAWDEGKKLAALAEAKGLYLGGAPDTFLGAGIQTCRKLIDAGMIGEPIAAQAVMAGHGHETWHPDPEFYYKFGGGPMLDMGPYYITALINLLGGVKSAVGVTKTSFKKRMITSEPFAGTVIDVDVPTHINGILTFDSGVIGTILTTFDVYSNDGMHLDIYGTEGTLICPDPNTFGGPIKIIRGEDKGGAYEIPIMFEYKENSRALGLADMAKAIESKRAPRASYKQTLHVLEIMTTLNAGTGSAVELTTKYERERPMVKPELAGVLD
ncbi:MAG: Gfo/Idh/MocA family oxidoreductase [Oscillospiraceae bacterium]|jgi:predicted dehydrogenase|nr:Gfo/Idh/MocA family oxidoreductase [Oscillospiraceae bacterium]